jgi:hypothetical protein
MLNYIIGGIGIWTVAKYGQIMIANYMINHPFMTTRFQSKLNQLKTD